MIEEIERYVLRRGQYGCKFLGDTGLQGRGENHVELEKNYFSLDTIVNTIIIRYFQSKGENRIVPSNDSLQS